LFLASRNSRIDSFIGDLSYPTYIVHAAVGMFLAAVTTLAGWAWLAAAVPAILIVAFALHLCVAKPVDRVRVRFGARHRTKPAPSISGIPLPSI
jgi:peptidoglycan/LPS O-acetylase OafA/YrhL